MPDTIQLGHHAIVAVEVEQSGGTFLNLGTEFREVTGVGVESETTTARPGSMAPPEKVSGTYQFTDVTLQRTLRHGKDSGLVQTVIGLAQNGARVRGTRSPTDAAGNVGLHKPVGFEGSLSGASESDYDADGNEVHTLSLVVAVDRIA